MGDRSALLEGTALAVPASSIKETTLAHSMSR